MAVVLVKARSSTMLSGVVDKGEVPDIFVGPAKNAQKLIKETTNIVLYQTNHHLQVLKLGNCCC